MEDYSPSHPTNWQRGEQYTTSSHIRYINLLACMVLCIWGWQRAGCVKGKFLLQKLLSCARWADRGMPIVQVNFKFISPGDDTKTQGPDPLQNLALRMEHADDQTCRVYAYVCRYWDCFADHAQRVFVACAGTILLISAILETTNFGSFWIFMSSFLDYFEHQSCLPVFGNTQLPHCSGRFVCRGFSSRKGPSSVEHKVPTSKKQFFKIPLDWWSCSHVSWRLFTCYWVGTYSGVDQFNAQPFPITSAKKLKYNIQINTSDNWIRWGYLLR